MKIVSVVSVPQLHPKNLCRPENAVRRKSCRSTVRCEECDATHLSDLTSPRSARWPYKFLIEGTPSYDFSLFVAIWFQRHPIDCVLTVSRHVRDSGIFIETKVAHHFVSSQILRNTKRRESSAVHSHPHEELQHCGSVVHTEERGLLDPKQGFPQTNALDLMAYREVFDLDYAMPIQREGGISGSE